MRGSSIKYSIGISLLSVLLMMSMCVLFFGKTYARYQQETTTDIAFSIKKLAEFSVEIGEWKKEDKGDRVSVTVSEVNQQQSYFTIRVASTLGMQIDKADILLIVTNENGIERSYPSESAVIDKNTELYKGFGPGNEYCFVDSDGNELVWQLNGEYAEKQRFILEVQGAKQGNIFEVVVSETKSQM